MTEAGLQQRWELADFAHQPVLYISKNKTAEFKYASFDGASRLKNLTRSWYINGKALSPKKSGACEASAGLRLMNLKSQLSRLKKVIIEKSSYPVKTANHRGQANKCTKYN